MSGVGTLTQPAQRIMGGLGGLALGDCMGRMVAKRSAAELDEPARYLLDRLREFDSLPQFGAQPSDDTILAVEMAGSVISRGHVDRADYEVRLRAVDPEGGKQIYLLKAAPAGLMYVAANGHTNGCVPRALVVGWTFPPDLLGDLCYDVHKVATLTHGHPDALFVAMMVAAVSSVAVAGYPAGAALDLLADNRRAMARLAGCGDHVWQLFTEAMRAARDCPDIADELEERLGLSVAADSSALTALVAALAGLPMPAGIATLVARRRPRWDLDSTAAIFGALTGSLAPDQVRRDWIQPVETGREWDFARLAGGLAHVRLARQDRTRSPALAAAADDQLKEPVR